jgi:hypothetical protein
MPNDFLDNLGMSCINTTFRLENSKSDNIEYAYNGEHVVIFYFSRSQAHHVNYEVIESVKNGIMFSGKYESCSKTFDFPHVVIFANFEQTPGNGVGPELENLEPEDCCYKVQWSRLSLPFLLCLLLKSEEFTS